MARNMEKVNDSPSKPYVEKSFFIMFVPLARVHPPRSMTFTPLEQTKDRTPLLQPNDSSDCTTSYPEKHKHCHQHH